MARQDPEPAAGRLRLPRGYRAASGDAALIAWPDVVVRLERERHYWLATTRADGRPHTVPIWGVWVDRALYFNGIPTAGWARNLARNPAVVVHLESGAHVVIVEGLAEDLPTVADGALAARIVAAWDTKYGTLQPDPAADGLYRLRPLIVRAWRDFPHDATIWRFAADDQRANTAATTAE